LGTEVVPVLTRKELTEPTLRAQALAQQLCTQGQLSGAIRIPDTVGHLVVTADLRAGKVTCHVDLDAPREGRPTTRVNWLVRQLKNAPDAARVECFVAHSRGSSAAELLRTVRETPAVLVTEPTKEIRSFRVATSTTLGTKRGRGRGAFIDSVLSGVDAFYGEVLGDLKAWSATPPKMRPASPTEPEDVEPTKPAALASTDLSSQDGPTDAVPVDGRREPAAAADASTRHHNGVTSESQAGEERTPQEATTSPE
jgi:hypothetical protein